MATKASATQTENQMPVINDMDDDALLKIEQEMKARLAEIAEAKKQRESQIKEKAFTEIETVIKKYFDTAVTREALTEWLNTKEYILIPKVAAGAKVGRRKINDEDLLFSRKYKNEGGDREMTLKLDAESAMPVPASGAYKELKKLSKYEFRELKESFKPSFFKFAETDAGKKWVDLFFPHIKEDLQKHLAS